MSRPVALVVRALGLGDFLTGLPAIRLIRHALPAHQLVLAADQRFQPLLPLIGYLDELYPSAELMPLTGFDRPVAVGIDLHGNGIASRRLVAELRPGRLIGFGNLRDGLAGPDWRPAEHEVRRWCRLVRTALGPARDVPACRPAGCVERPAATVSDELTVLHPGAAAPSRRWPVDRFVAVGRALIEAGHRVVVTGTGSEAALVDAVAAPTGAEPLVALPLLELFSLVAAARLVVSGDTGIAHLAVNYRTPSVTLFGPVSPALWGPPPDPRHVALWHGTGCGDPHGNQVDPALLRISVAEVLEAIASYPRTISQLAEGASG